MASPLPFSVSLDLVKDVDTRRASDAARKHAMALRESNLELLSILTRRDDLEEAAVRAEDIRKSAKEVYLLGTGGSSLGARTLAALAKGSGPKLRFFDNLDPFTFQEALDRDLSGVHVLAISKSGGTPETMMQVIAAADAFAKSGLEPRGRFTIVTENKKSALKSFAANNGMPVLDHPLGIGGRYSVLSMVGMLPALILGLDAAAFRRGAKMVVDVTLTEDAPPVSGAALHWALAESGRLQETVLWSYADALGEFGAWWRQLWGESLGKKGQGSTPVAAIGPCDQHSQLQLFLDGPGKALFTFLAPATARSGPRIPAQAAEKLGLSYLADKHIGDLVAAQVRATAETLAKRGRPVRVFQLGKLDEAALGGLFMHFMLETILMGRLMGVDPFDQPAVEEGKVLARSYLERKTT